MICKMFSMIHKSLKNHDVFQWNLWKKEQSYFPSFSKFVKFHFVEQILGVISDIQSWLNNYYTINSLVLSMHACLNHPWSVQFWWRFSHQTLVFSNTACCTGGYRGKFNDWKLEMSVMQVLWKPASSFWMHLRSLGWYRCPEKKWIMFHANI